MKGRSLSGRMKMERETGSISENGDGAKGGSSCYWENHASADSQTIEEHKMSAIVGGILESYDEHGRINRLDEADLPSRKAVIKIVEDLLALMFPGYYGKNVLTRDSTEKFVERITLSVSERLQREIERSLKYNCRKTYRCPIDFCTEGANKITIRLLEEVPRIREILEGDMQAAYCGDPAAKDIDEVILSYPCTIAIAVHRIAHELYLEGVPLLPRIMSEYAHSITGIDIHPGAKIGRNFFIDHGTGVVIGETTVIGDNVRIYQGVTLGALSLPKGAECMAMKGKKRHPTVEDDVIIYAGATILGGNTVIGKGATIGGNTWITSSVPPGATVAIQSSEMQHQRMISNESKLIGKGEQDEGGSVVPNWII